MPDLPAHIEEALNNLESPFATPDEKGKADAKLRAILEAAQVCTRGYEPTCHGVCVFCGREDCKPDCPHRKLKEAMSADD